MRKLLAALLCALLLPALALAEGPDESYVSYENYIASYAENLSFINENEGRHLISLIFASEDNQGSYRVYSLSGDIVKATLYTLKTEKRIAGAVISLTAPNNMSSSTSAAQDFTTGGYQCYALLMAMNNADTPAERFELVQELNDGLRNKDRCTILAEPYTVTARREGNTVSFTFASEYREDAQSIREAEESDDGQEAPEENEENEEGEEDESLVG